ncbi:MAG: hypothetical protein ACOX2A_09220 [Tepidanaerobacteraceae bacterium]|jgi:hypothetical protein
MLLINSTAIFTIRIFVVISSLFIHIMLAELALDEEPVPRMFLMERQEKKWKQFKKLVILHRNI